MWRHHCILLGICVSKKYDYEGGSQWLCLLWVADVCECCMLITEARMCNRGKGMSIQSVWLLQAGLIQALAKVLKQGGMGSQVREGLSEALKHLTASSQKNRDTLVASQALPIIIAHLRTGHPLASLMSAHYTPALPCLPLMHSNKQQLCILCS